MSVKVTAGDYYKIKSVTVDGTIYLADTDEKKTMTVPYTVPAANSGTAALFSSGSAEITVSAIFESTIVADDPTTWKIENNTLIVPEDVNDSLINAKLFNNAGGNFTGIDLSDTQITTIDDKAFKNCSTLTEIILPKALKTIGDSAFEGCEKLTTVTLPSTVTTIGNSAFSYSGLRSIELPASLTSIGIYAFESCSNLTSIDLSNTNVDTIRYGTFVYCGELAKVKLPRVLKTIADGAYDSSPFQNCEGLREITFYNVPTIGGQAFRNLNNTSGLTVYYPSSWDSASLELLKQQLGDNGGLMEGTYTLTSFTYPLGF